MKLLSTLLFFLVLTTAPATAQDTLAQSKARQLLELSGSKNQFMMAVSQMIDQFRQNPQMSGDLSTTFWDEFEAETKATAYEDLEPKLIQVYVDNYTEAELDHQIAYYEDPTTQELLKKQPVVMQQSMSIGQAWGMQLGQKISERLTKALEDKN